MKKITKELNTIKKWIAENWGNKCGATSCLCPICIAWEAYEKLLELNAIDELRK